NGSGHALLTLLPSLVSRACTTAQLERRLLSKLTVPLQRSSDFDAQAGLLGLAQRDADELCRFSNGLPLTKALASPTDRRLRKLTLVLAYILLELELLRPVSKVQS
ncbi:MAG: hypothetical protein AAF449_18450, partial [Myxococcota bacterium]